MSVSINGTGGITFADASTQSTGGYTGFRNRIINGDMRIDQRNAGASVTPTNSDYTLDRWKCLLTQSSVFSVQQNLNSVTPPAGFTNYLGAVSLASTSLGSSDRFVIQQPIEGYNISDLGFGTANAKPVALSFWVRSSLTGTFGGSLVGGVGPASYPYSYTIDSANTWEYKTVFIPGPTIDTWNSTTSNGVAVRFSLGCGTGQSGTANAWAASTNVSSVTGAVSVVGTSGATFYITGVQLEKGSAATPFEFRPYGQELALCQRYYYKTLAANGYFCGWVPNGTAADVYIKHPVTMRAAPSATITGTIYIYSYTVVDATSLTYSSILSETDSCRIRGTTNGSNGSAGGLVGYTYGAGNFSLSSEL